MLGTASLHKAFTRVGMSCSCLLASTPKDVSGHIELASLDVAPVKCTLMMEFVAFMCHKRKLKRVVRGRTREAGKLSQDQNSHKAAYKMLPKKANKLVPNHWGLLAALSLHSYTSTGDKQHGKNCSLSLGCIPSLKILSFAPKRSPVNWASLFLSVWNWMHALRSHMAAATPC